MGNHSVGKGLLSLSICLSVYLIPISAKAEILYYITDHLGSSETMTDDSGEVTQQVLYTPFGETVIARDPALAGDRSNLLTNHLYTGQEHDSESNLYYYGARFYDSALARFTRRDPVLSEPPYAYVGNNPLRFVDPNGRAGIRIIQSQESPNNARDYLDPYIDPDEMKMEVSRVPLEQLRGYNFTYDVDIDEVRRISSSSLDPNSIGPIEVLRDTNGELHVVSDNQEELAALLYQAENDPRLASATVERRLLRWLPGSAEEGSEAIRSYNLILRTRSAIHNSLGSPLGEIFGRDPEVISDARKAVKRIKIHTFADWLKWARKTGSLSLILTAIDFAAAPNASALEPLGAEYANDSLDKLCEKAGPGACMMEVQGGPTNLQEWEISAPECDQLCRNVMGLQRHLERDH